MWTTEQLEAINITGVNTTVSASAGAGKTAVLVQRLMKRILKDNVSVDEIVSLTFTDAAAAEMKNRLMSALLEAYALDPDNDYLLDQITLLPSANISTIHSFCLRLLKDHYYALNLNPESLNNIIDDADNLSVQEDAFNYMLENFDQEKISNVLNFLSGSAMSLNILNEIILALINSANGTINPNQFLYNSIKIYDDFETINDIIEPFKTMFYTYHQDQVEKLKTSTLTLLSSLDTDLEGKDASTQIEWLNSSMSIILNMEKSINNFDYNTYQSEFVRLAELPSKTITGLSFFTKLREKHYEILNSVAITNYTEDDLLLHLSMNKTELNDLIDMAIIYNDYYKDAIKQMNKITFNDMETLTYELLNSNNQEIAKIVRAGISDILVDEFQDTNELQDEIIKLIGNGTNIFRVGDIKQSIYRFRGAEPSIMQSLIDLPDSDEHKTIYLSNNFRSKDSIVQYNNHFFDKLMNLDGFQSNYLENDNVIVGTTAQKEDSMPVQLAFINSDKDDEQLESYGMSENDVRANFIASKIVELYKEEGNNRWNRFTVLVNAHSSKIGLKTAFDKANIPYFISLPDGLYTSKGVSTIIAYLRLVYDPSDAISLMAILTNLFNYSDNQISQLFLQEENLFKVADQLDSEILNKIKYYHYNQSEFNLSEIVDYVYSINGFYEYKISKQERVNLDIFYDIVIDYDQAHSGVYGLLNQVEKSINAKSKEGSSISSEDNVVNVMTIHNSKGLQFETVFLLSKSQKRDPNSSKSYLIHPKYGLAMKSLQLPNRYRHNNLANFLIRHYEDIEAVEEEMRKLYVALTRAQKELYIVDSQIIKEEMPEIVEFDTNLVLKTSFTKWMESAHKTYPSKYLNSSLDEQLVHDAASVLKYVEYDIKHLSKELEVKESKRNSFKAEEINLSQKELSTDIGTLVHNTIERLPNSTWSKKQIIEISPDLSTYYITRLLNLSNNSFFKEINQYDVYKEYPFISETNNIRERGIIDYLVESDDSIYIIDFKTDSLDLAEEFLERYTDQLQYYKSTIQKQFTSKTVKAYIYSFKLEQFIEV